MNTYEIVRHGNRYMVRVMVDGIVAHYLTGEHRNGWAAERAAVADGARRENIRYV